MQMKSCAFPRAWRVSAERRTVEEFLRGFPKEESRRKTICIQVRSFEWRMHSGEKGSLYAEIVLGGVLL